MSWYLSNTKDMPSDFLKLTIDESGDEDDDLASACSDDATDAKPPELGTLVSQDPPILLPKAPIWWFTMRPAASKACVLPSGGTLIRVQGVHRRPLENQVTPTKIDDSDSFDLAYRWFTSCLDKHATCRNHQSNFRPTRLLEIGSEEAARVIITQRQQTSSPYATLSHCWGKTIPLKLLRDNYSQLCSNILIKKLPTSYQEAIRVCRRFGFSFLWIDSLCIIQDSDEDWQSEAATMKDVYENSILNTAAAAATESYESSFSARDPSLLFPLAFEVEWDGLEKCSHLLMDEAMFKDEVEDSPLRHRAWVLQEVYLTPRSLYLTKSQLWWECRDLTACEIMPTGLEAPALAKSHPSEPS